MRKPEKNTTATMKTRPAAMPTQRRIAAVGPEPVD
jgi:hypothetical protein